MFVTLLSPEHRVLTKTHQRLLNHRNKTVIIEHKFAFYQKGVTAYDQNGRRQYIRGKRRHHLSPSEL